MLGNFPLIKKKKKKSTAFHRVVQDPLNVLKKEASTDEI